MWQKDNGVYEKMTEEQLNEGKELFATIVDLEERLDSLSQYDVAFDCSDTYLVFDEHVKVLLPEYACAAVVEVIRAELEKLIDENKKEFAALGTAAKEG